MVDIENKTIEERLSLVESDIQRIRRSLNHIITILNVWLTTEYPGWGDQVPPV